MRTKQVRPEKLDYEYELYISKDHDETVKKDYILFDFRTKKVFENFAYEINVLSLIDLEKKVL
ncbi:MAG: hypothetical protein ABIY50_06835, partial [Ignavibacteria bacterium]